MAEPFAHQAYRSLNGDVEVWVGDCRGLLPLIPAGSIGAIVSDPPYGIGYSHGDGGNRPAGRWGGQRQKTPPILGDDQPFDPSHLLACKDVFLWGANHYASRLPEGGRWLAWDKKAGSEVDDSYSDVDFAWHSRPGASRIISYLWKGVASMKRGEANGKRWHPAQKPVAVMLWSIEQAGVPQGGLVVDPYGGSGTTAVACMRSGRRCIVMENDRRYIPVIIRRIEDAETPLFSGNMRAALMAPAGPGAVAGGGDADHADLVSICK